MNLADLETAALSLPEEERKLLANRLWASVEYSESEADEIIAICDHRESEADSDPDGWQDASEFIASLKNRNT